jgi:nitrate reductase NapE component
MAKPIHTLIFQGKLKPKADRTLCVEKLAKLFKKDVGAMEARLFSGKKVVIGKTEDKSLVDKYVRAFDDAGAILQVITEETATDHNADAGPSSPLPSRKPSSHARPDPKRPSKKKHAPAPQKKRSPHIRQSRLSPMTVIAITLFMIILIGVVGGYVWVRHHILRTDIPQTVIDMENALAMDGLVALGHGNIEKAIALETLFLDEPDDHALINTQSESIIGKLQHAGMDPRKAVKQLLLSLHVTGKDIPDMNAFYSVVLIGQFNPDRIRTFMEREYTTHVSPTNDQVVIFTKQDGKPVELAGPSLRGSTVSVPYNFDRGAGLETLQALRPYAWRFYSAYAYRLEPASGRIMAYSVFTSRSDVEPYVNQSTTQIYDFTTGAGDE